MIVFRNIALRNIARDFRVIPLYPYIEGRDATFNARCKRPMIAGWPERATRNPATIELWSTQFSGSNVGGVALCGTHAVTWLSQWIRGEHI